MLYLEKFLNRYWWVILLVLTLPACWALSVPGYYGASDDLHIGWLDQMVRIVSAGQFPPRFVPDLSYGFGYPLFNFVFPLPFYIGAVIYFLGLSLVDSVKIVFGLSFVLSAFAMFGFLRRYLPIPLALVGSLVYLYTPYRSTDVYVRGAFGESLAFVFFPLILHSLDQLLDKKSWRWIAILALAIAGLVLSHNIATYMFLPFVGSYVLIWLYFHQKLWKNLYHVVIGAALGIGMSSYFWLPALLESGLMKYDTVFDFKDHFPTLLQLITPHWGYGASVPGPYDGMSFFIGIINWLIVLLSGALLIACYRKYTPAQKTVLLWGLSTFFISIIFMNFRSIFLWEHLPMFAYFQFPWRFLMMTTFASSTLLVACIQVPKKTVLAVILGLVVVLVNAYQFRPHDFLGRMDHYYLHRYIPYPVATEAYKMTQEEYLRLMTETQRRPDKTFPLVSIDNGSIKQLSSKVNLNSNFTFEATAPATIHYYKYNFPGWQVELDNQKWAIENEAPYGNLLMNVPAGSHQMKVYFSETPLRQMVDIISLVMLCICLGLFLFGSRLSETIRDITR